MLASLGLSLLALAALFAAGLGLEALLPRPLERSWWSRAGYAYLLGIAWMGWAVWATSFWVGAGVDRTLFRIVLALPCAAGLLAILARRGRLGGLGKRGKEGRGASRGQWPLRVVGIGLVAVSLALLASASLDPVTDFDGRMTWGTQAKYLQAAHSVLPRELRDARFYVIHPRYPILMPLAQVAMSDLAGVPLSGRGVRALYALFVAALAAAVAPALVRAGGRRGAAIALALLFLAPVVLWNRDAGASGTYSDLPLAAFLGAGFCALLHPRARREAWRGLVAGLLLAAALGSKNEGLLLAPAAVAIATWLAPRRAVAPRTRRAAAAALAMALVVAAAATLFAWRAEIPNRNDEGYFERLSLPTLVTGFATRLPTVFGTIARHTVAWNEWGALFWILPLVLVVGRRGLRGRAASAAGWLIAVESVLVLAAYSMAPNLAVVDVTWNRFLIQMLVPLALLLAGGIRSSWVGAGPWKLGGSRRAQRAVVGAPTGERVRSVTANK